MAIKESDKELELKRIDAEIKKLHDDYGREVAALAKQPGFDIQKAKYRKMISKLSKSYAPKLVDLSEMYSILKVDIEEEKEIKRRRQYKDAE